MSVKAYTEKLCRELVFKIQDIEFHCKSRVRMDIIGSVRILCHATHLVTQPMYRGIHLVILMHVSWEPEVRGLAPLIRDFIRLS